MIFFLFLLSLFLRLSLSFVPVFVHEQSINYIGNSKVWIFFAEILTKSTKYVCKKEDEYPIFKFTFSFLAIWIFILLLFVLVFYFCYSFFSVFFLLPLFVANNYINCSLYEYNVEKEIFFFFFFVAWYKYLRSRC